MTRIIGALADIQDAYDVLFCDLWGCVHNGVTPYPAAVAALLGFRAKGGRVVLMTNAPRPASAVRRMLDRMALPPEAYDIIVSSGDASQFGMMAGDVGRRVWHLGPAKDDAFFDDLPPECAGLPGVEKVPLEEADGIVCTGLFDEYTEGPEDYRARFLLAKTRGLKLLCANPDIVVDWGDRRLWCAGALAELYTEMGGTSLYYGKPHPPIYDLARRRLAAAGLTAPEDRILAVGDGITTDVQGGMGEGIDTLFITGGLAAEAFGPDVEQPDASLLRDWLAARQSAPTWTIGRLR